MSTGTKKDNSVENYELLRMLSLEVLGLNLFGVADILPVRDSFLRLFSRQTLSGRYFPW